jgi:hypothetical protein
VTWSAIVDRLNDLWWVRLPAGAAHRSQALAGILADGRYLAAFPVWSAIAPPLVAASGVIIGRSHPAFAREEVFIASLLVLIYMLSVGTLSAAWGLWLTLGYCIGDFFLYHHRVIEALSGHVFKQLIVGRLPLLIPYCLLGFALMFIPLISQLVHRRSFAAVAKARVTDGLSASMQALPHFALVLMWTRAAPSLIRPVYTWSGGIPTTEVMQPLQVRGVWVALAIGLVCAGRVIVERRVSARDSVVRRSVSLSAALVSNARQRLLRWPRWVATVTQTAMATFLVAGLLGTWLDALAYALVVAIVLSARARLQSQLVAWGTFIARVPLFLRFVIGMALCVAFSKWIVTMMWSTGGSFRPVVISAAGTLMIFSALLPDLYMPVPRARPGV